MISRFILGHRTEMLKKLEAILAEPLEGMGFSLVDIEFQPQGREGAIVRLFVDRDSGIDIGGCTEASRLASSLLDVEDPIQGAYKLEVSSPGLDRRLATAVEIDAALGSRVQLRLVKGNERRNLTGKLMARNDESLEIEEGSEKTSVPLERIQRMNLIYDFGG
ncbi:MAG: ribosome maturation factor RimP [Myxococcales bacterium]|nr:ribosome maturation factor RimP [Myxococcales bacterium]